LKTRGYSETFVALQQEASIDADQWAIADNMDLFIFQNAGHFIILNLERIPNYYSKGRRKVLEECPMIIKLK
jgi:hypothetical protein